MDFVDVIILIIGIKLIGLGFLVKVAPEMIAGYNTMPASKKRNVDVKGLSSFMRGGLIVIGLLTIAGHFGFKSLGYHQIAGYSILVTILGGSAIVVIGAQRFDHNKSRNKSLPVYLILTLSFLMVGMLLFFGIRQSDIHIHEEGIRIRGMYGIELGSEEIDHIELRDNIPPVQWRINGFSLGSVRKGHFKIDEFDRCRLLLHSDKGPYLLIRDKNGNIIIVNYKDSTLTEKSYHSLMEYFQKAQ